MSFGHFISEENTFTIDPILFDHSALFLQCFFFAIVYSTYFPRINFRTVLLKDRQFNRVFYMTWEESSSAFAEEKKVQFL